MSRVDEVISLWTEEERQEHAPLIEECREREANLEKIIQRRDRLIKEIELEKRATLGKVIYTLTKRRDGKDGRA